MWSLPELQELLDEWAIAKWQNRPHEGLRDPDHPGRLFTTVEIDAEEVAAALTYATGKVTKTYRQGMPSQGGPAQVARPASDPTSASSPSQAPAESHPF